MTPRSGLYVAFVGLGMAVLCCATLFLLRDWSPDEGSGLMAFSLGFRLSVTFGVMVGIILMVMGLFLSGIVPWKKQVGKPGLEEKAGDRKGGA